jgi:hypothetical protein
VNGGAVAEGTTAVAGLLSDGDLYFGARHSLAEGSFFSALFDDIRVYNEALGAKE